MKCNPLIRTVFASALALCAAATSQAADGHLIKHSGDTPSVQGSASMFTGLVRQDSIARADEFSKSAVTLVTFEPGSRTFWHSHPSGQRLLVTFGKGLVGARNGRVDVVRAGDFIWCPPKVAHWHGASPDSAMSHIALTNVNDATSSEWGDALSDEEYARFAANAVDPIKE